MNAATFTDPIIRSSDYPSSESTVRDWFTLLKPGVMSLVVFTGAIGMWMAPNQLHPLLQFVAVLSIALGSGAGAIINMWYDRDIDAVMLRTRTRPIAAGRIPPQEALAFGIMLSLASVTLLGLATNLLAAGILAFAIFFYGVIYTIWLKRSTPQNIVIGGAAGAFPPVIGWAAATGDVSLLSLSLFLIIFLWTPPHFWALALYRNDDYRKAGIPMMPVVKGADATKRQMLIYTYLLVPVTFAPVLLHQSGLVYALAAGMLGYSFIKHARTVYAPGSTDAQARAMFGFSILYLFILFGALLADRIIDAYLLRPILH